MQSTQLAYLVDSIRLVVVDYTYLACICELEHLRLFNVDHVRDWQAYLDAVAVIVTPKDDPLKTLDPLLGTRCAISAEVIGPVVGLDGEVHTILVLVGYRSRNTIPKVDLSMGKV